VIRDRGSNFTSSFDAVFQAADTRIVRTAVQAPRMNAICERLVGTLRRELLDRVLILGEAHLRTVLAEYQVHYITARPHQGIGRRIPDGEHDGGPHHLLPISATDESTENPSWRPDQRILTSRLTPPKKRRSQQGSYFRAPQARDASSLVRHAPEWSGCAVSMPRRTTPNRADRPFRSRGCDWHGRRVRGVGGAEVLEARFRRVACRVVSVGVLAVPAVRVGPCRGCLCFPAVGAGASLGWRPIRRRYASRFEGSGGVVP
jgi:Integrase core domain